MSCTFRRLTARDEEMLLASWSRSEIWLMLGMPHSSLIRKEEKHHGCNV